MAISHATQELLFIKMLCKDFGIEIEMPINVYGDNQGSMDMIRNPSSNERSKHIDIRHHFVREKYSSGLINVTYKDTNENIADLFTKPATRQKLKKFIRMLFGRWNVMIYVGALTNSLIVDNTNCYDLCGGVKWRNHHSSDVVTSNNYCNIMLFC